MDRGMTDEEVGLVADQLWREVLERKLPESGLTRIRGLLDILARRAEPQLEPMQGMQGGRWFMPDLPGVPWMDRAPFEPLASELEALYPELRQEILNAEEAGSFRHYGYVTDDPNDFRRAWSPSGWDEVRLWENFKPTTNILEMPASARALKAIAKASGSLVNHVSFLSMKPGTLLPSHQDRTNWYVSIHLGIIVPPGCAIRVAGDERGWEDGKCIFFNNSFSHEAWNYGDSRRLVFAAYLAHPLTTAVEREALRIIQSRYLLLSSVGHEATIAWAWARARAAR